MCTRTKESLKVLFSLQAELGCRVLSEFQCQGRNCHHFQSCIRSRCGVYVRPHRQEGGHECRGDESNRTYHRQLSLSVLVCLLLDTAELAVPGPLQKEVSRGERCWLEPCPAVVTPRAASLARSESRCQLSWGSGCAALSLHHPARERGKADL